MILIENISKVFSSNTILDNTGANDYIDFYASGGLYGITPQVLTDINENLYILFLDKDMQYSCAYFHNENISLDQAQSDKKQHIINKLNIKNNMKVLDIGCGWGGLALQIARETGAYVKGITLSKNQLATILIILLKRDFELVIRRTLVLEIQALLP